LGAYGAVLAGLGAAFGIPTLYALLSLSQVGSDAKTLARKCELVRFALLSAFFLVELAMAVSLVVWLVHHP
jgi:hypothetical protein